MRVVRVRIGKLVSGDRFSNFRAEFEAEVDEGEDAETVAERLESLCDQQIRRRDNVDRMGELARDLTNDVAALTAERKNLAEQAAHYRKLVEEYEGLGALARERGIAGGDKLVDDVPF